MSTQAVGGEQQAVGEKQQAVGEEQAVDDGYDHMYTAAVPGGARPLTIDALRLHEVCMPMHAHVVNTQNDRSHGPPNPVCTHAHTHARTRTRTRARAHAHTQDHTLQQEYAPHHSLANNLPCHVFK